MSSNQETEKYTALVGEIKLSNNPFDSNQYEVEKPVIIDFLNDAIPKVFDVDSIPNSTIFIKPNLNFLISAFNPYALTDPRIILSVAELFHSYGAKKIVVGEKPGQKRKSADSYKLISDNFKIPSFLTFDPIDTSERVDVKTKTALVTQSVALPKSYLDADIVVNIPKMKTHTLTKVSLGMKNLFGLLTDEEKMKHHNQDICLKLVDLLSTRPPEITLIDGVIMLEGQGPLFGKPKKINRIILSNNTVVADSIAATIMGISPNSVDHLHRAKNNQLGETNINRVNIINKNLITPIEVIKANPYDNPVESVSVTIHGEIPDGYYNALSHSLERISIEKINLPKIAVIMDRTERFDLTGKEFQKYQHVILFGDPLNKEKYRRWENLLIIEGNPPPAWALYNTLITLANK